MQIIEVGVTEIRRNDVDTAGHLAEVFPAKEASGEKLAQLRENSPFARLSFVPTGAKEEISSDGSGFLLSELPFRESALSGTPSVSKVYLSDMGAWTYTVQRPVYGGELAGGFYADVLMERYDNILPDSVFQDNGLVYLLDAETLRFIYEPTSTSVFIYLQPSCSYMTAAQVNRSLPLIAWSAFWKSGAISSPGWRRIRPFMIRTSGLCRYCALRCFRRAVGFLKKSNGITRKLGSGSVFRWKLTILR